MAGYQQQDPRQRPPVTPPQWQQQQYPQQQQPYGYGQQQYPPQGYAPPPQQAAPPRKKRRIFLWVFLAIQVLFIIWIIAGAASKVPGPTAAQQAAAQCANGGWQGLFTSQADCTQHYAVALNDAGNAGKGIGVAIVVLFWVVVDFFLGVGYVVYKLARR
jgi:hypothetical protein